MTLDRTAAMKAAAAELYARYGFLPVSGGSGEGEGSGEGSGGSGGAGGEGAGGAGSEGSGGAGNNDGDAAARALAAERTRAETAEKELREARKRLKEIDDRDLTELQKAQQRADEAEKTANSHATKVRELTGKEAILTEAIAANAKRPAAIFQIVKDQLQFDEKTGEVTNAKAVIDQAKKDVPELFGITGNGNAGSGNGGGNPGADMNALIRQAAGKTND